MTNPADTAAFEDGQSGAPASPANDGAAQTAAAPGDDTAAAAFTPLRLRRYPTGWTAFRQRKFLDALAETGNVTAAAEEAGACVRSAYRLRLRPDGKNFAAAWDQALTLGAHNLLDIAIRRATIGSPRGVWREGRLVGEEDVPSDRLLMFLLAHLQPTRFGRLSGLNPVPVPDTMKTAEAGLPALVGRLADITLPSEPDEHESFTSLWDEPPLPDDAPTPPEPSPGLTHARARLHKRPYKRARPRTPPRVEA